MLLQHVLLSLDPLSYSKKRFSRKLLQKTKQHDKITLFNLDELIAQNVSLTFTAFR